MNTPTPFQQKVYELLKQVPAGSVTTYKALAEALQSKGYRAIRMAMRCNPYAPQVPCHRVVASDGSLGGFKGKTSGKEIGEKKRLLENEGVQIQNNRIVDFEKKIYHFQ